MNTFRRIIGSLLVIVLLMTFGLSLVSCMDISLKDKGEEGEADKMIVGEASQTVTVNGKTLTLDDVDALRVAAQQESFEALTETGVFDDTFVEALKSLYKIYDADLYIWLANLYDPAVGGFYYSNSGRDNVGFLPDLESTAQALALLDKSGLDGYYDGNDSLGEKLSDETKLQIYNFALSLKADDGYFYHPQWGTSISSSRKGRDRGWGNDILAAFGSVAITETSLAYSYDVIPTSHLYTLDSLSVPKVVLASATSSAAQFSYESWEDLKAYVDYWLDVKKDSYTMGNTLNSNIGAIESKGLRDDLVNYLIEKQFDNGLWEEETDYNAINGLMKMCGFFGGSYSDFPNVYTALSSMMEILLGEIDENGALTSEALEANETVCYVYNPWITMYKLVNYLTAEEKALLAETLKNNAPELMNGIYQKLFAFKKTDGGFSYYQDRTSAIAQSAPVAIANTPESDVNSTGLALSTVRYVLRVYQLYCGYEFEIPMIYTEYDTAYFLNVLESRTPVQKIVSVDKPGSVTFEYDGSWEDNEEWEDGEAEESNDGGVVLCPSSNVTNVIGDSELDSGGNYKWFASSIVNDPTGAANKVLSSQWFSYDTDGDGTVESGLTGDAKETASTASGTVFGIPNAGVDGNTYVFEFDFYFDSSALSKDGCIAQIMFVPKSATSNTSQTINIYSTTLLGFTTLYLEEDQYCKGAEGSQSKIATLIPTNQWVNLRFEVTKIYSEDGTALQQMTMNTYVNDSLKSQNLDTGRYTSDGAFIDSAIDSVKISYYKTATSHIYLDNVYAAKVASSASVDDYYPGSITDDEGCDTDEPVKHSVSVKDSSGEGIADVELQVTDGEKTYEATTNASGNAILYISANSKWTASILSAPSKYAYDTAEQYSFGEENSLTITLDEALLTYTVTVKDARDLPIPGVELMIVGTVNGEAVTKTLTTDNFGTAVFNGIDTDWTVTVISAPEEYVTGGPFSFTDTGLLTIQLEDAPVQSEIVKIDAKTIVHSDKTSIAFRIDSCLSEDVLSGEIDLNVAYRWADGNEWRHAAIRTRNTDTDSAVFVTEGVAAYNLAREVTAVAYIGSEMPTDDELESSDAVINYSVAEFLYNMLYRDGFAVSDDEEKVKCANCYLALLKYGAASQRYLLDNPGTLVTEYPYVYTAADGVTVNGDSISLISRDGNSFYVTPTAVAPEGYLHSAWTLRYANGEVGSALAGDCIEIDGIVELVPVFEEKSISEYVHTYETEEGVTTIESSADFTVNTVLSSSSAASASTASLPQTYVSLNQSRPADYGYGSFLSLAVDPKDTANQVLSINTVSIGSGSGNVPAYINYTLSGISGNSGVLVFETDYYIAPTKSGNNSATLDIYDVNGKSQSLTLAYISGTARTETVDGEQISTNNIKIAGKETELYSHRWTKLLVVYDTASSNYYVYYSVDSGTSYTLVTSTSLSTGVDFTSIAYARFNFSCYSVSYQAYADNTYFICTDSFSVPTSDGTIAYGSSAE